MLLTLSHQQLLRLASYSSVITAFFLILAKLVAWGATNSTSILATLVDSVLDAMASLVNLYAIRFALQPADANHRFGHGKAEQLAGLAQSAFIIGAALFLLLHAVEDLMNSRIVVREGIGIVVMVISIGATLILLGIQRYVIKKTGSVAIAADSLHYRMDLLANLSVIAAMLLSMLGIYQADGILALAIVGYMLYGVRDIIQESIDQLMDRSLPEADEKKIEKLACSVAEVIGIHDLRTRRSGNRPFIQMHLELDGAISLQRAHTIGDQVMARVLEAYPDADVTIHQDPV